METSHKFWDKPNQILFVAAAAGNAADFAVTRANLQSGGRELNPIVRTFGRSSAGLAMNFAGETAGVISLSYFFHKTGHHKLERAVSLVNIGSSTGAVSLRTVAPLNIFAVSEYPSPPRSNAFMNLAENGRIISGPQSVTGKILNTKYLRRRRFRRYVPSPPRRS